MGRTSSWGVLAGACICLAGCHSDGGPATAPAPPATAIATTSRPSTAATSGLPEATRQRATAIIKASRLFARVVAGTDYTLAQFAPGTSGTIPNLRLVFVTVDVVRPIVVPTGVPYLDYPGEGEPGYGQPIPLDQALRTSTTARPGVSSLQVAVDVDGGRVVAIRPWRGG